MLLSNAFAVDACVPSVQANCTGTAYTTLTDAITALNLIPGPHTITVFEPQNPTSDIDITQSMSIIGMANQLTFDADARFHAKSGAAVQFSDFVVSASTPRTSKLFQASEAAQLGLSDLTVQSLVADAVSGALVQASGPGTTVVVDDLLITSATLNNGATLLHADGSSSISMARGSLANIATSGPVFRAVDANLSLLNSDITAVNGSGSVLHATNSTVEFSQTDVADCRSSEDTLFDLDGSVFSWTTGGIDDATSVDALIKLHGGSMGVLNAVSLLNLTSQDAAIEVDASTLMLQDSSMGLSNSTKAGHLWAHHGSTLNITGGTFEFGGCAFEFGETRASSLLLEDSTSTLSGTTFAFNTANVCTGTVALSGGVLTLDRSLFDNNESLVAAGVYLDTSAQLLQGPGLINRFTNNTSGFHTIQADGMSTIGTLQEPFRADFTNNNGGGISSTGDVYVADSTFSGQVTLFNGGGAIQLLNGADLSLSSSVLQNNQALRGGAISAADAQSTINVTGGAMRSNQSTTRGGAIFSVGSVVLTGTAFESNTSVGRGGAIYLHNDGDLNGNDVQFESNVAGSHGGAISLQNGVVADLRRVSFINNTATNGSGGGVSLGANSTLSLQEVFSCGNAAGDVGKGLFSSGAQAISLEHTIWAQHSGRAMHIEGHRNTLNVVQSNFVNNSGGALFLSNGPSFTLMGTIEASLFFGNNTTPISASLAPPPDLTWTSSMVFPAFNPPAGIQTTDLQLLDPQIFNPSTTCDIATFKDFIAGPTSPAWFALGAADEHYGAYRATWGDNEDIDLSPLIWDCDNGNFDNDPTVFYGAIETCNGVDDNCDGIVDEGCFSYYPDSDQDGYGDASAMASDVPLPNWVQNHSDCDDTNADVNPVASETCNGTDDNCDGEADEGLLILGPVDLDLDGYSTPGMVCSIDSTLLEGDCDDANSAIHPGAVEHCDDGIDDNCDGINPPTVTWYRDEDGDGSSSDAFTVVDCISPGSNYSTSSDDCDDNDAMVFPGAAELCNQIDDDCNGTADDGLPAIAQYLDVDGDGFGIPPEILSCALQVGYATNASDCDDTDPSVNPEQPEQCDSIDHNCDGSPSNGVMSVAWYADGDDDGFGDAATLVATDCVQPPHTVADHTDCDDTMNSIHPSATEVCDNIDNDCDGLVDDMDPEVVGQLSFFDTDQDGDGYGLGDNLSCFPPTGAVFSGPDCDDADPAIHPGAAEFCVDGIDNDCDGLIDAEDADFVNQERPFWRDDDGDQFGDSADEILACTQVPVHYVPATAVADCNDNDAQISPSAAEICDGVDNNCNGLFDGLDVEDLPDNAAITYFDLDNDGFGGEIYPNRYCPNATLPPQVARVDGDCNDAHFDINPDAVEDCSDTDRDCSGDPYDAAGVSYDDSDGDGFGDPAITAQGCPTQGAWVFNDLDCNPMDSEVNPDAQETCDPIDRDCDGDPWNATPILWVIDRDCDGLPGGTVEACDPSTIDGTDDACPPTVYETLPDILDCDDMDPSRTLDCSTQTDLSTLPSTGCACNSGAPTPWFWIFGLPLLLARRRPEIAGGRTESGPT